MTPKDIAKRNSRVVARRYVHPRLEVGPFEGGDASETRIDSLGLRARSRSDGTSAIVLSPTELIEKLAALVPYPRKNLVIPILDPGGSLRS